MSENKSATLMSSNDAAEKNFSTENKISGGCVKCGCEALIHYQYDSGKPVPDAPFVLTDSNGKKINGRTDADGLCLIYDMGCGTFELLLDEGSDTFEPEKAETNNPVLQNNPEYARLAGEYFTLFLLLRQQGLLEYDAEDSSDKQVTVNDTGWLGGVFTSVPENYRDAYVRFRQLERQVNQGNLALKEAMNKIHHRLAAEVADHVGDDNTALLLFCQIALGFVPVVGQAIDFYAIGEWAWDTWKTPDSLNDPLHIADGVLCAIGFIPGLGDAIKVSGRAILRGLEKSHLLNSGDIQFAIRTIRGLSDGNLVKGLSYLQGQLKHYGAQARALLSEIHTALSKTLTDAASNRWIVQMIHAEFRALVDALGRLIEKFDASVAYITARLDEFVAKIVTRTSGSGRPKGSYERKNAEGISAATVSVNAGRNRGDVVDKTRLEQDALKKDETCLASSKHCQTEGEPVDMATGAVVDWRTDFTVPGFFPLEFRRFYRSTGERHSGLLGSLWRCQWDMHLALDNGLITLVDGEFNQHVFASPDEGQHQRAASGPEWRLSREQGQLKLRHVDGVCYEFEYAQGKQLCLTSIEDRVGNRIILLRDRGTLRWIVLPDRRLIFAETEHNRLTTLRLCDKDKNAVKTLATYRYDVQGHLLEVRAGEGRSFDYRYSPEGWMLRWNDLSQTWVEHTYDSRGRALTDRTSGDYWRGRYVWDDETLTGHYHNGFGGVVSYTRDHRNYILCRRQADGGETRFEWLDGELAAQTDPLGNRTEYQRNQWGQVVAVTRPDGTSQRYDYNEEGVLQTYTDPCDAVWQYEHDPQGLLLAVQDPENRRWEQRWTARGQLASLHAPDGREQYWHYNAFGLRERVESTGLPTQQFLYDKQYRLIERRIVPENGKMLYRRWEYKGRSEAPCLMSDENGTEHHLSRDAEGNLTAVRDSTGRLQRFVYGAFDNLREVMDPEGATIRLHYNAESAFAGVTNSRGKKWFYRFDSSGRLSEEQHYDRRVYRYEHDLCGQVTARLAPDGSALRYRYDENQRLVETTAYRPDGETEGITCFSYDAAGRLLKAAGPDAVVEYEWSPSGRVVCERVNGQEVRSVYDETGQRIRTEGMLNPLGMSWHQGRLASLSVGEHQPLTFSHNAFGFEQRRSNNQGFALNHEWSETGQLLRQTLTPDSGRVNDLLERRYQYDALSRLTEIRDSHWGYQEFRLNGNGQVSGEKRVRGERRQVRMFGYDSELNLAEIQSKVADRESLTTPPPLHKEHTQYDVAGRVISRGDTLCRYDECGRLIVKRRERDGFRPEETHFSWDANDRLIRVQRPDGARWRYRYDAFGRRVSKTREGNVESARSLLRVDYCWDGDQLVGEQQWLADGSAARAVQWVYEPGSFRPLAQVEKQGETARLHYIVTDLTGTARELCSEEGEVHWRGEQGLWGRYQESKKPVPKDLYPGDAANEEVSCDLRYPGQLYDVESGLYYNRYRYYDPELGQYLSPDPIGLAGGIRPQGYVHNPQEWIDPLGLVGNPETATHITYQGIDSATGKPYVGYASMQGKQTGEDVLSYRYGGDFSRFDGQAPDVLYEGYGQSGKNVARGLEQRTFEGLGGLEGTANKQNPVGPGNLNRNNYLNAADEYLGNKKVCGK
ncbi:RHS repeat-associated core domain-containing protein [Citrobacter sp. ESBL3]|uniref:RHS repeat-associated core domain-containing protein n=1 Tax=Citrobacter sp. ESBL3 TaxID=3077326 RepID=UPI002FCC142A